MYDNTNVDVHVVYTRNMFRALIVFLFPFFYIMFFNKELHIVMNYLISINITTVIIFGLDKFKAVRSEFRVPEAVLHTLELLGGTLGAFIAMLFFNHKISKLGFFKITWIIAVIQTTAVSLPVIISFDQEKQLMLYLIIAIIILILIFIEDINYFFEWLGEVLPIVLMFAIIILIIAYVVVDKSKHNDLVDNEVYLETNMVKNLKDMSSNDVQNNATCNYYYVQANNLNVRAMASSRSKVVDTLHLKQKLCITKKETPWYYILDKGWVHSKYLVD